MADDLHLMIVQAQERVRPQGPWTFRERIQQLAQASTLLARILNTIAWLETQTLGTKSPVLSWYMLSILWLHVQNTNTFLSQNMLSSFKIY